MLFGDQSGVEIIYFPGCSFAQVADLAVIPGVFAGVTTISVDDMVAELEDNALNASDHYKDTYLEITGKLSNIDSSGKYINLDPVNSDFSIYGVQCYISDDAQRNAISNMKKGDTITLKGQCTDVGEVLGYSLDIDEIE